MTPLRLAFGRFNVLFWCHGMTLPLVCWAFDVGAWPERRSLVKLALPGLQKAQCFHRNTIDFGQLERGRRRGVTMFQGHAGRRRRKTHGSSSSHFLRSHPRGRRGWSGGVNQPTGREEGPRLDGVSPDRGGGGTRRTHGGGQGTARPTFSSPLKKAR